MDNEKEISFGAFDSELMHQEIFIPEGFTATIEGDKIILTRKDSEDERIRKELIGYIVEEVGLYPGEDRKEHKWLRWLEKQGEHKKFRDSIQVGDEVTRNSDGVIVNMSQLKRVAKPAQQKLPIEKLPEEMKTIEESLGFTTQKECDEYNQMVSGLIMSDEEDYNNIDPHFGKLINKVEPKFKVGKWYIDNEDGTIFQIVKVLNNTYTYKTNEGKEYSCSHYSLENDAHLWTIQDAKGGDVLCYKDEISLYKHDIKNCTKQETTFGGFVYHCCYDGKRFITDSLYSLTEQDKMDIHPATKEQRDLLFQKMKEAGYEWDSEKKELKKIELSDVGHEYYSELLKNDTSDNIADYAYQCVYCMSHDWAIENPTWDNVQSACRLGAKWQKKHDVSEDWSEEDEAVINKVESWLDTLCDYLKDSSSECIPDIKDVINKLNSLRHQKQWKPSDAQIRALEYIINNAHNTSYSCKIAKELLEQLKKLKGE